MNLKNDNKGFLLMDVIVAIVVAVIGLAALSVMYSSGAQNLGNAEIRGKQVMLMRGQASILSAADGVATTDETIKSLIENVNAESDNNDRWSFGKIELDGVTYYAKAAGISSNVNSDYTYKINNSSVTNSPTIYSVLLTCDNADVINSGSGGVDSKNKTQHYLESRVYVTLKDDTGGTTSEGTTGGNTTGSGSGTGNGGNESGGNEGRLPSGQGGGQGGTGGMPWW